MTSGNAGTYTSPLAAIALKVVGLVTILASMLDFLVLLIPPDLVNRQWQLATTTQIVDRGIVPLVGMALLMAGFWVDSNIGKVPRSSSLLTDLRFWTCLLASVLGVVFLLLALLHPNNVRLGSRDALQQVSAEAGQAETQLEERLSVEVQQRRNQLGALLQDSEGLEQAIAEGQIGGEQAALLQQFQSDPGAIDQYLQQQAGEFQQQAQTQIGSQREEAERRVRIDAWKSGLRISISSLLLAGGYTVIGWTGLRRLLSIRGT